MDNSFISRNNIDNIYDNINAYFVKNHNYNLDNFLKFRKIVKKISRTIFNSVNNKDNYKDMVVNDFNELVLNQSKEFLIKEMKNRPIDSNYNPQANNSNFIENKQIKKRNKTKKKKNSFVQSNEPIVEPNNIEPSFLESFDSFNAQVQEANKKIKNNFKEIINQTNQNFNKDMFNKDLEPIDNKRAFEQKLEENLSESTESLYDDYSNTNVKDILESVILNQKDYSSGNEIKGFTNDDELLFGEEKLNKGIYHNTGPRTERIEKKIITIDSGTKNGGNNELSTITNTGNTSNQWHKFRVDLQDIINIDSLCDVYLRSFTMIGATVVGNCSYFVLGIDEFNVRNFSNNPSMRNKLTILNTNETASNTAIFSVNYGSEDNYVTSINPSSLSYLNITLTNQDNKGVDDGANETFTQVTNTTNRVIFELEFKTRVEIDESIYEKSIYDNA